ncbi:hypothetical protein GCM10027053_43850 [Intrasporangium mesophilum]
MSLAMRIEVLPARLGDCLLVECLRPGDRPWRMLVDGGPPDTWPLLEARLRRLPKDDHTIDVALVTHIDSDHIGGMLPLLSSDLAGDIRDFWFNGRTHLPGADGRARSIEQGEGVVADLLGSPGPGAGAASRAALPWNVAFGGGPIDLGTQKGFPRVNVPDGPTISVVSPTTERLRALSAKWAQALQDARRASRPLPAPDVLEPLDDLVRIAARKTARDTSVPNGSSVGLIVEHRGVTAVLAGDSYGTVLATGLTAAAKARGKDRLDVDVFKLPHHGSEANVLRALVAAAPAKNYIVSSNGDVFHHPDDAAVARVVTGGPPGATLWFNYKNDRTARWGDPDLMSRYGHSVVYPDPADPAAGVVLELPAG